MKRRLIITIFLAVLYIIGYSNKIQKIVNNEHNLLRASFTPKKLIDENNVVCRNTVLNYKNLDYNSLPYRYEINSTFLLSSESKTNFDLKTRLSTNKYSIFRTYQAYYIGNGNGYFYPDRFSFTITPEKITYNKNGKLKNWYISDKGIKRISDQGAEFKYHKFYLYNQKMDFYVSYDKIVKHDGTFYYLIILDGQYNLCL